MTSVILATATRYLMPMLLLFSAFLLFRGHNLPGGGFIGGLVAAATFILHSLVFGVGETRKILRVRPVKLMGLGLLIAMASGLVGVFTRAPFLTGKWYELVLGQGDKWHVGTPVFFDVGVYLVVIGATLIIILSLAEED